MFCPGCGRQVADTATFCPQCGRQLAPRKSTSRLSDVFSKLGAVVPNNVLVALAALLVVGGLGFGVSRILGGGAPSPYKLINTSPEKLAKKLDKLCESEMDGGTVYFSSKEFRDYVTNVDALDSLGEISVPKKYAGEYLLMVGKEGLSDSMSKAELKLGIQPEAIICIEFTKDKAPSAKKYIKQLKRKGVKYDHVLAVSVDDVSSVVPLVSEGQGLSSLFYSDDMTGVSGIVDVGTMRMRVDMATKSDSYGVRDVFEMLEDEDTMARALDNLGASGVDDFVFE